MELRAKSSEMRLQPLRIGVALLGPSCPQQGAALEHLAGARDERGKKTKFRGGQIESVTIDARDVRLRIHAEATDGGRGPRRVRRRGAAQQRAHAGAKLF